MIGLVTFLIYLATVIHAASYSEVLNHLVIGEVNYNYNGERDIYFNPNSIPICPGVENNQELLSEMMELDFTSFDNDKMVSDLVTMLEASIHDGFWGDALYLYMLVRRNGIMDDMAMGTSSAIPRAVNYLPKKYGADFIGGLISSTTSKALRNEYARLKKDVQNNSERDTLSDERGTEDTDTLFASGDLPVSGGESLSGAVSVVLEHDEF